MRTSSSVGEEGFSRILRKPQAFRLPWEARVFICYDFLRQRAGSFKAWGRNVSENSHGCPHPDQHPEDGTGRHTSSNSLSTPLRGGEGRCQGGIGSLGSTRTGSRHLGCSHPVHGCSEAGGTWKGLPDSLPCPAPCFSSQGTCLAGQ